MRKPRTLKRTSNFCSQCAFFAEDGEQIDEYQDGYCDFAEVRVDYYGGACRHFRYVYEGKCK